MKFLFMCFSLFLGFSSTRSVVEHLFVPSEVIVFSDDVMFMNNYVTLDGDFNYVFVLSSNFEVVGDVLYECVDMAGEDVLLSLEYDFSLDNLTYISFSTSESVKLRVLDFNVLYKGELINSDFIFYKGIINEFSNFLCTVYPNTELIKDNKLSFTFDVIDNIGISYFKERIVCIDSVWGDVSNKLVYTGDILDLYDSVGTYYINVTGYDGVGNSSVLEIELSIVDSNDPVISGPKVLNVPISLSLNEVYDFVLSSYKASDLVDGDLTDMIEFESFDLESFNKGYMYKTSCVLMVRDSSGNVGYLDVELVAYDDIKPEVSAPDLIFYLSDGWVTNEMIMVHYKGQDNYTDKDNLVFWIDDFSEFDDNTVRIGTHVLTVGCKDEAGNITYVNHNVTIVDDIGPAFYLKSMNIKTNIDVPLSNTYILDLVSKDLTSRVESFEKLSFISSDYFGDNHDVGSYLYKYCYMKDNVLLFEVAMIDVFKEESINVIYPVAFSLISLVSIIGVVVFVKKKKF